jgi:hypothetical protein
MISLGIPLTNFDLVEHIDIPSPEVLEIYENTSPLEDLEEYENIPPLKDSDNGSIIADLRDIEERISKLQDLIDDATTKEVKEKLEIELEYTI